MESEIISFILSALSRTYSQEWRAEEGILGSQSITGKLKYGTILFFPTGVYKLIKSKIRCFTVAILTEESNGFILYMITTDYLLPV